MDFKVLKGGIPDQPTYKFIDAYITDTRLMGVLGLRVHWLMYHDINDPDDLKNIYHFYYFDIEELGLDSLKIFQLDSVDEVKLATQSCFGGLGAYMMLINEKEARYLINYFVEDTIAKKEELPKTLELAQFVLEEKPQLTKKEYELLVNKMCAPVKTNYGAVNYYLMRMFALDFEGASFLKCENALAENFDEKLLPSASTFLQNTIDEFKNPDGSLSYLSESLVQTQTGHSIVISEIKLEDKKVSFAKKKNDFEISVEEASMKLIRNEYVSVYQILTTQEDFYKDFIPYSLGMTKTDHDNGEMYMDFYPNNDHVEKKVFNLNADLRATYYISEVGELIIATYTPEDMEETEYRIKKSALYPGLFLISRMQLGSEMVFEFAQSGAPSFVEYINALSADE